MTGVPLQPPSEREPQVLRFLVQGSANPRIAETLHIGQSMLLRKHILSILIKPGAENRVQPAPSGPEAGVEGDEALWVVRRI